MDSKPISLTKSEQALARDFGDRMAAALRDPKSQANAASARLSSHGINAAMMGLGKLAEVAFAKWAGLNLHTDLRWDAEPDDGVDAVFAGRKWDVKHTERGHLLLWPFNKVKALQIGSPRKTIKMFDTFCLARGGWDRIDLIGWCQRSFFEENAVEAVEAKLFTLTAGTLILDRKKLRDLAEVKGAPAATTTIPELRRCHQCGSPADGSEREVLVGGFLRWLHQLCEPAFMDRVRNR